MRKIGRDELETPTPKAPDAKTAGSLMQSNVFYTVEHCNFVQVQCRDWQQQELEERFAL
ncbi:hypothetical protein HK100_003570, partial [Physocladia obscura]